MAMRCCLEAPHNDPDSDPVARQWLDGRYDEGMKALTEGARITRRTVEGLRIMYGPVTAR